MRLACSSVHSVVVSDKGQAFGWGSTTNKQLGPSGLLADSFIPNPILLQLPSTTREKEEEDDDNEEEEEEEMLVASVACGTKTTTLLFTNGQICQWEDSGTLLWRPVNHKTLVASIACGAYHSLLIDSQFRMHAWGNNKYGQLGLGDFSARDIPTLVNELGGMLTLRVSAGERHSLCASQCGDCFAFGFNEQGQLGLGHNLGEPKPRRITALESRIVVDVQCGAWHSGALTNDGLLFLFGSGSFGKLGNGSEADVLLPLRECESLVDKQSQVLQFSLGETHSACVLEDGRLFVWGSCADAASPSQQQSVNRFNSSLLFPEERKIGGGVKFSQVCCSKSTTAQTLAVERKTGNLYTWQANGAPILLLERLMQQPPEAPLLLQRIPNKLTIQQVATGTAHVLLRTANGTVFSFGANDEGQCGMKRASVVMPQLVEFERDIRIANLACGWNHSLVVTLSGRMFEFGRNKFTPTLVRMGEDDDIAAAEFVSTGENHSACVTREGKLFTWGQTSMGKLGLGPLDRSVVNVPTQVLFSPLDLFQQTVSVATVSCSKDHTLVACSSGQLFGFGLLAGREIAEEPRKLLEGEQIVQVSAGETHSLCINKQSEVFRSTLRDKFSRLQQQQQQVFTQAVACADGRSLLLSQQEEDGGMVYVLERNETVARQGQILGLSADVQAIANNAALTRDGQVYYWTSSEQRATLVPMPLTSEQGGSGNNDQVMQLKNAMQQVQTFKYAFMLHPESCPSVPVFAMQTLLRNEARRVSEFSNSALLEQLTQTRLWDRRNLDQLLLLKRKERHVLSPLELSCEFTVQHASRIVAEQDSKPSLFHKSKFFPSKRSSNNNNMQAPVEPAAPTHLIAAIPILETMLSMLLVNPGYMFELYKRQESHALEQFAGLCRDLYASMDAHSERLFTLLVLRIVCEEITTTAQQLQASSNNNVEPTFEYFTQRAQLFFPTLFDLIPIKYQTMQGKVRSVIRKELLLLRSEKQTMDHCLRRLFLEVFVEQIIGDICLRHHRAVTQLFSLLYLELTERFGLAQEDAIALWTCRFMAKRLFLPVLFEQCIREDWPELYYEMDKLLEQALHPVPTVVKRVPSNFEQTLSRYHGVVRGNLPIKERIELDQLLIEATTGAKKRDFVLKFEDAASRFRLFHIDGNNNNKQELKTRTEETETTTRVRQAALDIIRKDFLVVNQHKLEVELVFDLIREELRPNALVIFPTRRTLEYTQRIITKCSNEEISSQNAEWRFFLSSCRQAAREMKGRWDEAALDIFDDFEGTALRLDLSNNDWLLQQQREHETWTSLFRLDALTNAPIPARFTNSLRGDDDDVLGMRALEQVLANSEALRAFKVALMQRGGPSMVVGDEDFTRSSFQVIKDMEGREALYNTCVSVQLLQEALAVEISEANRIVEEKIGDFRAYSNVLRMGDKSKTRLREVAKRKLGPEFELTDFHFIRTIQLETAKPPKRFSLFASCFSGDVVTSTDVAATWKQQLSDHGLVRGAFASYTYAQLIDRQVITRKDTNLFQLDSHRCGGIADEAEHGAFQQLFEGPASVFPSCPFEDTILAETWPAIIPKLRFHFSLSSTAKFSIQLAFDASTVISQVEIDMFQVVNFSKTCTLDWTPQGFPVSFRVRKLLFLVQEMVLKSFM